MDVIKSFNQELSSLYNSKPPISKAKITTITRLGIKAIKFYKHVVQSIEKFIMKCKPEYKVPALYVIDSLVRQSKHQFQEKDVFGPRFARNLKSTFYNLYQVSPDDKSKIIRVLNLWQKNEVFSPDIIHPLFEMADSKHPLHQEMAEVQAKCGAEGPSGSSTTQVSDRTKSKPTNQSDLLQQLQNIQSLLQTPSNEKESKVKFDGKLLDFDYGEEDHEEEKHQSASTALSNILNNPEVLKQLQLLQSQKQTQMDKKNTEMSQMNHQKKELEMAIQEKEFDKHLAAALPNLPFASMCDFKLEKAATPSSSVNYFNIPPPSVFLNMNMSVPPPGYQKNEQANLTVPPPVYQKKQPIMDFDERITPYAPTSTVTTEPEIIDLDNIESDSDDRPHHKRSHSSRSNSRLHSSKRRSRSRSSRRHRSRSYDREEKVERHFDKEKEGERRRKCLPAFKKNHLAVCSTTLWVGHLSKLVQEEELSDAFGEFGDVVSINLIPPRGCAFVMMNRRQDAARAMYKLKNTKLQGKPITLAWAPGKGMKDKDWKDYWEVQDGVSYIPYKLLNKEIDYDYLEDGGVFDEDTVPLWLKDHLKTVHKKQEEEMQNETETSTVSSTTGDLLSGTKDTMNSSFISLPPEVPLQSSTPPIAPAVPVSSKNSALPLGSPPPPHLLMPPFGVPGLGPMGMSLPQPPLMPNLGVPPPNLFNMHCHQLLTSVPPPPRNPFHQNMPDFPNGFVPLPFNLQHPH